MLFEIQGGGSVETVMTTSFADVVSAESMVYYSFILSSDSCVSHL